jgi:hypothetical protein
MTVGQKLLEYMLEKHGNMKNNLIPNMQKIGNYSFDSSKTFPVSSLYQQQSKSKDKILLTDDYKQVVRNPDGSYKFFNSNDTLLPDTKKIKTVTEKPKQETPQWVKDKNTKKADTVNFYETLNYKKWGLKDYSDYSSFNSAFRNSRENKEKEFIYKDKRFNTNLVDKKESDLYWESKKFLNDYIKTENYRPLNIVERSKFNKNSFMKETTGLDYSQAMKNFEDKYAKIGRFANESQYIKDYNQLLDNYGMDFENTNKNPEMDKKYKEYLEKKRIEVINSERPSLEKKLKEPYYFSITDTKPKDLKAIGYYDQKNKKLFTTTNKYIKDGSLNTTYIHELSHKADNSDVGERTPVIDVKKFPNSPNWDQKFFDYVSNPTEIEARKMSTLFYLHKNKKPYKNLNLKDLIELARNKESLPSDINQLLDLFEGQPDDLIKYLNNDFSYKKALDKWYKD